MSTRSTFAEKYQRLENQFRAQAKKDGHVYLPNIPPSRPVDFVLIAMEPSLRRWARTSEDAEEKVRGGFRNFMFSFEDFLLHFAARRFLCRGRKTYHITDLSKGAMPVNDAERDRWARWSRWYPLLESELDAVAKPRATIYPIGQQVGNFLNEAGVRNLAPPLLHYSQQASKYRSEFVRGRESDLQRLASEIGLEDIEHVAQEVMAEAATTPSIVAETLARIRRSRLTTSRRQLLFVYKTRLAGD